MAGIEDILKLENDLSKRIEKAEQRSKEVIEKARQEAEGVIESAGVELSSYQRQKEGELKTKIEGLRRRFTEEFKQKKKGIEDSFNSCKQELKDYIIKRILGYDS